jgi:DNA polymerase (family 10)
MMDKHAVARVLEEIAAFLELRGENVFKVRAFQNAARTVGDFTGDLAAALASGELAAVKGIGPATLDVVRECLASGRSGALEMLRGEVPPGLVEMLRIGGMGVAKVRTVHEVLGIATLAELESAVRDGRLAKLPRFGEKTAAKVLKGLEFLRRTSAFRLAHHAARQADQLRETLAALPGIARVEVAGSVRRRCEVIRDVDLVVATTAQPRELGERLVRSGVALAVIATDPACVTIRLTDDTTADIYCAAPPQYGHALAWATGSTTHLALLGAQAASQGFALDASGLTKDGAVVTVPDEETFFGALCLAWIPPELREGTDEIPRAAAGPLPRLIERSDLRGLLHSHTNFSDGANSIAEMAEACRALGYAYLGITDHSEAAAYAGGLSAERVARQHEEIDAWNRGSADLRILKGIEADILADGRLDYAPEVLDSFDFVIGSVHSRFDLDERTMTERVLRALDDPHLTILGHPTGRLLLTRDPYEIDLHQVIARAAERGVAIEINADPQRLDLDWRLCREARSAGVAISIGTDAHSLAGLANADLGVGIARKGWLEAKDILNTRDAEGFLDYAKARR